MKDFLPKLAKEPIRVLFVARHQIVREGLKLLIESDEQIEVVATVSFEHPFDEADTFPVPDVSVIYLDQDDRVEVISDLLEVYPDIRVVVAAACDNLALQATALDLGAVGIVHAEQKPDLLTEAIKQTFGGDTWLNQALLNRILRRERSGSKSKGSKKEMLDADSGFEALTNREREVLELIGNGFKNKQIASHLTISEPTVRCHLSSIFGKLGVGDRLNLVIRAYQIGLLDVTSLPTQYMNAEQDIEQSYGP